MICSYKLLTLCVSVCERSCTCLWVFMFRKGLCLKGKDLSFSFAMTVFKNWTVESCDWFSEPVLVSTCWFKWSLVICWGWDHTKSAMQNVIFIYNFEQFNENIASLHWFMTVSTPLPPPNPKKELNYWPQTLRADVCLRPSDGWGWIQLH